MGALDSIIDIVGAVFAIEWFKADKIVVSPINVGGGMVKSAHGVFPVPAPATVALLTNTPVYSSGIQAELLTPTGALILTDAPRIRPRAADDDRPRRLRRRRSELTETPNVVRVLVGEASEHPGLRPSGPQALTSHHVAVLECEIDDMNPQIFGALMDKLYGAGALEVFYSAVQMKKNRPGTLMTIVAKPEQRETMIEMVFRESTTIGVRYQELWRECLDARWSRSRRRWGRCASRWRAATAASSTPSRNSTIWRNCRRSAASQSRTSRRSHKGVARTDEVLS